MPSESSGAAGAGTVIGGMQAAVRVVIASPDPTLRMVLRRLLADAADIAIAGSSRFGEQLREAAAHTRSTVMLVDGRTDETGALAALHLAAKLGLKSVLLRGAARLDSAGAPVATTLPCPADPAQETVRGEFTAHLMAALRGAVPKVSRFATAAVPRFAGRPEVVAIGSSTGGPQALNDMLRHIGRLSQPIILTQHMPPRFTTMLAQQISSFGLPAVEATAGLVLQPGHLYVAPGGHHLLLARQGDRLVCTLDDGPPENFCRPAVDPMLRSVVRTCGGRALAVILTGMGSDGLAGCRDLVKAGGLVLAQDEATSVVWGMPGAVAQAGLCHAVLPLGAIAKAIVTLAAGCPL